MAAGDPQASLPPALARVAAFDPALHRELADDFVRLAAAAKALSWAQSRLPDLIAAGGDAGVLRVLVAAARDLTGVPNAWAVRFRGDVAAGKATFRALAADGEVPAPDEISHTVVAQALAQQTAVWSDDAGADARFTAAHSVQAYSLRSVGCVPVGKDAVLYLHDPETPNAFPLEHRLQLTALARLVASFLKDRPVAAARSAMPVPGMVGDSPAMGPVYDAIRAFAPMPWPALILGESGSGKEAVAQAMHGQSPRKDRPFLAVNCGAIPAELAESTLFGHERGSFTGADRLHRGVVERVADGTLFLDEVAELSGALQVKLLRLLQERTYTRVGGDQALPFRGRIVAATHRPIDDAARRGAFREDLYFRLAACVIAVPPLRDRVGDVAPLATHLLGRALADLPGAPRLELTDDALVALGSRTWPGNVRELENTLRTAVARALAGRARVIDVGHLGPARVADAVDAGTDLASATDAFQRRMVEAAIAASDGNRTKAAERLGVTRQWLHRLLARWEGG